MAPRATFGVFDFDYATGELRKQGIRLRLPRQSAEILRLLLERPGELVTRAKIQQRLWPNGVVVEYEHSINTAVARLREVLGESATVPRMIETVPACGYRMLMPVQAPAEAVPAKQRNHRKPIFAAVGLGVALLALAANRSLPTPASTTPVRSIAIIPFLNLSGDRTQDHLVEWMTEQLISRFAAIKDFTVTSHTSVLRYKAQGKSVPEIGRDLKADAVLEGSVRVAGDRVYTTARLIDSRTDRSVWSDSYERPFSDMAEVESQIARAIVTGVRIRVRPGEMYQLVHHRPVRREALEAYLKGRHAVDLGSSSDHGVKFYREAVRLDPGFALAWATLAQQQASLLQMDDLPLDADVLFAAKRALELDGRLAEAHVVRGDIEFLWNWNWAAGEAEYRRALELNPGSVDSQVHFGYTQMMMGRFESGLEHMKRALDLDPFNPVINAAYGYWMRVAGQPRSALSHLTRSIELNPSYPDAYSFLARVYQDLDQPALAMEAIVKAGTLRRQPSEAIQQWKESFRSGGLDAVRRSYGMARVRVLAERARTARVSPVQFAAAYAEMGENVEALKWLEQAYRARSPLLPALRMNSSWDRLRSDPGFQALVDRMALR